MLAEDMPKAKRQAKHKTKGKKPRRLTVPTIHDGSQLQTWAVANGLPIAPVGFDTAAYYRFLCCQVENKNHAKDSTI